MFCNKNLLGLLIILVIPAMGLFMAMPCQAKQAPTFTAKAAIVMNMERDRWEEL